jgi:hypothetical protein
MVQIVDPFAPATPSIVDPFAAAPDTSATQRAGVAARTLAPYATAAAAGAAMGVPFGGVGAIPGAIAGVGALGVGNLAAGAYNLAAPMFGGQQIATPSESIRNVFAAGGVGRKPTTPEQALAAATMEGALDATSLTAAGRAVGGRIGNFFSQRPVVQAVGGAGGAAVPTAMREYGGVENPYALAAGSLAGGITAAKTGARVADIAERTAAAGRRMATNSNISSEALRQRAAAAFDATDASGVIYDAPALSSMAQTARQDLARGKFDPTSPRYTAVNAALARVDDVAQGPQSIGNLHSLRQDLNFYLKEAGPDEARLIGNIVDNLDDFVANPRNATFASPADAASASNTLKGAISDWSKLSKSSQIEDLVERASRVEGAPFASALRTQFRTLANNPARMRRFDEAERETIKAIASGATESATLKLVSQLAPSLQLRDIARTGASAATAAAGMYTGSVPLLLTAAGMTSAGLAARGGRNMLAGQEANALAAAMRRGDVRAPVIIPTREMFQRGIPQSIMQAQQPSDYFFSENAMRPE